MFITKPATNPSGRCLTLQFGEHIMTNKLQNFLSPSATGLRVLVAYDNLVSGIEAKDLCDRLAQHFKPACPLALSFWSLSALQLPLLAGAATEEAGQTDLLIVAVHGDAILPPPINSWISRSVRRLRSHAGALVAQLHDILRMNQETSPAYECLKRIAQDSGVDFFLEVVNPADEALGLSIESLHQHANLSATWNFTTERTQL
jgi:hypothetical protein